MNRLSLTFLVFNLSYICKCEGCVFVLLYVNAQGCVFTLINRSHNLEKHESKHKIKSLQLKSSNYPYKNVSSKRKTYKIIITEDIYHTKIKLTNL